MEIIWVIPTEQSKYDPASTTHNPILMERQILQQNIRKIYKIDKSAENRAVVQFELAAAFDLANIRFL